MISVACEPDKIGHLQEDMKAGRGREDVLRSLTRSVATWNIELATKATREAMELGISPKEIVEEGLGLGMVEISRRFDEATLFLPQVLAASNAMDAALAVLEPMLGDLRAPSKGTIVLGTVQGDIHEIGKNVVCAMLKGAGYNVIDLGRDVPTEKFIAAARKHNAFIIGASALMTTTLIEQRRLVELMQDEGLKDDMISMFGGAPCTKIWVDSIGGDLYCANGAEVVQLVDKITRGA